MSEEATTPTEDTLQVGHNGQGEVVMNLPCDMTGHIVFSPEQARHLADVLQRQAKLAEELRVSYTVI